MMLSALLDCMELRMDWNQGCAAGREPKEAEQKCVGSCVSHVVPMHLKGSTPCFVLHMM